MAQISRVLVNTLATYGRGVVALLCGIFTSRWLLMSLGAEDYGIFGLVSGLVVFVTFFNQLLASATMRFYAIGENVQSWFSTALILHGALALMLFALGTPLGLYAVDHWLVIPSERLASARWVFICASVGCFVSMLSVPFSAMWTAKQHLAEVAGIGLLQSVLNLGFVAWMVTHPGDWLTRYAAWMMALLVGMQVVLVVGAWRKWSECRFAWNARRMRSDMAALSRFAWWQFFGNLGVLAQTQGVSILINRVFGPVVNSSHVIAGTVGGHTQTLSASLRSAFEPVVVSAYGAGDFKAAEIAALRVCRVGSLMFLVFAIPLALELDEVLTIWLKTPPAFVSILASATLAMLAVDKLTVGHMILVNASGKIEAYQAVLGSLAILTLPIAGIAVWLNGGVAAIAWTLVVASALKSFGRVLFARRLVGLSMRCWLCEVVLPIGSVVMLSAGVGCVPRLGLDPSFGRVVLTTLCTLAVFVPVSWFFVLSPEEKKWR